MQENKKYPFDITYMFIIANKILLKYTQKMEHMYIAIPPSPPKKKQPKTKTTQKCLKFLLH